MLKLYGIPNCDTVKKARKWLESNGINYEFVDFRKNPLSTAQLKDWAETVGLETLLNKRSRTWRELDKDQQDNSNSTKMLQLMQKMPTLIKRPVLVDKKKVLVGFNNSEYGKLL